MPKERNVKRLKNLGKMDRKKESRSRKKKNDAKERKINAKKKKKK